MKIAKGLTDQAVLAEIGARFAGRRLALGLSQAEVAEQAGVGKRTVERIEAGESAQVSSFIRILRVLDALAGVESVIPEAGPRPMELLQRKGRTRQRAPGRRALPRPEKPWSWGDES